MNLKDLWKKHGRQSGLTLRWPDWGQNHRWFKVEFYDPKSDSLFGKLDCGEKVSFSMKTNNWKLYEEGDEFIAKAC